MAPTRPNSKKSSAKAKARAKLLAARKAAAAGAPDPKQLLAEATARLQQGEAAEARRLARRAWEHISSADDSELEAQASTAEAIVTLLGEIAVEMGEVEEARTWFLRAVDVESNIKAANGDGGGAEKFLWLAQLSEEGGQDSVQWFERGAAVLRREVTLLEEKSKGLSAAPDGLQEKKNKLAETLCAVAEVYMTDLSWEADAEQRCESLVTEASLLAQDSPDVWQTVASVRISQSRTDEARAALDRSLALWQDLDPEDVRIPGFPTRVSLVRLLMEVGSEEKAVSVAERLVAEDDESVEVWYLGGYGLFTLGQKLKEEKTEGEDSWKTTWKSARTWLKQCLLLFQKLEYEDDRLGEHAEQLLDEIKDELGDAVEGEDEEDDGGWEDTEGEDGEEDEDMQ
jgi:tetratricopeptide (TPR) repeat protein